MASDVYYIYGKHAVQAYLAAHQIKKLYYSSHECFKSLRYEHHDKNLLAQACSHHELNEMAQGGNHQGLVAEIAAYQVLSESALEPIISGSSQSSCLLILDQIQDPHNLGACLRTAAVAGVDAVVITKDHSAGLTPAVAKVASGALGLVPVIQVTNLVRHMKWIKQHGYWLYGADEEGQSSLYEQKLTDKVAWVMGNEGKGLRSLTKSHCDVLCQIPSSHQLSCLNVSVATGVCLFETMRQSIVKNQSS